MCSPTKITGGHKFTEVHPGRRTSCGLDVSGAAWCWGDNLYGARGDGVPDSGVKPEPQKVAGGHTFRIISVGGNTACGIEKSGSSSVGPLYCWGSGESGQVGSGSFTQRNSVPVPVAEVNGKTLRFTHVSVGADGSHVCGIVEGGVAYCWGANADGQLDIGNKKNRAVPAKVDTSVRFKSISAGAGYTCGISTDNVAYCWGDTASGALGTGKLYNTRTKPVKVSTSVK